MEIFFFKMSKIFKLKKIQNYHSTIRCMCSTRLSKCKWSSYFIQFKFDFFSYKREFLRKIIKSCFVLIYRIKYNFNSLIHFVKLYNSLTKTNNSEQTNLFIDAGRNKPHCFIIPKFT